MRICNSKSKKSFDFWLNLIDNITMNKLNETISTNLVNLRKHYGLKQSEVAEKLNYSDKTISKWETGEIIPSVENLIELAKLYNVTLDQITNPMEIRENKVAKKHVSTHNKLMIALLSISVIWIITTIVFVYANLLFGEVDWVLFIWAVPISFALAIIFNSLWGNKKMNYVYISFLVWTLITAFYLQFLKYNLIPLFFIGIPAQIAIFLWSGVKKQQ